MDLCVNVIIWYLGQNEVNYNMCTTDRVRCLFWRPVKQRNVDSDVNDWTRCVSSSWYFNRLCKIGNIFYRNNQWKMNQITTQFCTHQDGSSMYKLSLWLDWYFKMHKQIALTFDRKFRQWDGQQLCPRRCTSWWWMEFWGVEIKQLVNWPLRGERVASCKDRRKNDRLFFSQVIETDFSVLQKDIWGLLRIWNFRSKNDFFLKRPWRHQTYPQTRCLIV